MRFTLSTWNINSVRLRIDLVAKFLKLQRPDVLCLQETKCQDDAFPAKRFKRLGYEHIALNGQKGYHGVAIVSKLPFAATDIRTFCDIIDSRHISVSVKTDETARQEFLDILETMGPSDPRTAKYRRLLSSHLY